MTDTLWTKNGRTKAARSPADEVKLKFDGYTKVENAEAPPLADPEPEDVFFDSAPDQEDDQSD